MSIKSLLQIILLLLIFLIIGGIYYIYFYQKTTDDNVFIDNKLDKIENTKIQENEGADQQILEDVRKDQIVETKTKDKKKIEDQVKLKETKNEEAKNSNDLNNLTKEIRYVTTNKAGDIFEILAEFGKTNLSDSNILDLETVNGKILSSERSNIYIKSDFAQYNYTNQNSKFYNNVEINYDNKTIICDNLDLNISENIAIAYSNVKVKDDKSVMEAQVITMDIITKNIEVNSEDNIKIFIK